MNSRVIGVSLKSRSNCPALWRSPRRSAVLTSSHFSASARDKYGDHPSSVPNKSNSTSAAYCPVWMNLVCRRRIIFFSSGNRPSTVLHPPYRLSRRPQELAFFHLEPWLWSTTHQTICIFSLHLREIVGIGLPSPRTGLFNLVTDVTQFL